MRNNLAIFFTNKAYVNDKCESISLEEHLNNVNYESATPDCWDSFDKLSTATDSARRAAYNGNDCIIVDLHNNCNTVEAFDASDYENYQH